MKSSRGRYMKIKEVEQMVGINRTNIYFYEKEGLLHPNRDNENNYREYSEEDVQRLQQIKILRLLGVSISDIKLLGAENVSLEDVMKKRLKQLEDEEREIQNLRKVCTSIIEQDLDVRSLNEDVLTGDKEEWRVRLEAVLAMDLVEEVITRKQINTHLTVCLMYGYFINVIVSLLCADFFSTYFRGANVGNNHGGPEWHFSFVPTPILFVFVAVVVGCFIGLYVTASVKWHLLIFHLSAIITTPLIIEVSRFYTDGYEQSMKGIQFVEQFSGTEIAVAWVLIMAYVLALYLISKVWDKLFTKVRYVLPIVAVFTILYTGIAFAVTGVWNVPLVFFLIMTLFIGVSWSTAIMDRQIYNRYYAVVAAAKMMNVFGTAFDQRGRGSQWAWMK